MTLNRGYDKIVKTVSKELNEKGWKSPLRDFVSDVKAKEVVNLVIDTILNEVNEGKMIVVANRLKIKKYKFRNGKSYIGVNDLREE